MGQVVGRVRAGSWAGHACEDSSVLFNGGRVLVLQVCCWELDAVIGPLSLMSSVSTLVRYARTRLPCHWIRLDTQKPRWRPRDQMGQLSFICPNDQIKRSINLWGLTKRFCHSDTKHDDLPRHWTNTRDTARACVCVWERERESVCVSFSVCVCVRVWERECVCVFLCVCVCERECVCFYIIKYIYLCVCACVRERESVCMCYIN